MDAWELGEGKGCAVGSVGICCGPTVVVLIAFVSAEVAPAILALLYVYYVSKRSVGNFLSQSLVLI